VRSIPRSSGTSDYIKYSYYCHSACNRKTRHCNIYHFVIGPKYAAAPEERSGDYLIRRGCGWFEFAVGRERDRTVLVSRRFCVNLAAALKAIDGLGVKRTLSE